MVKQLDFGLPPNFTECFNLQFENNRGFIQTKVRKNDGGTSAKKNVCLLPPFGSRHSRSSCNLCLKDRQKRPQFFCRCFQVLKRGNSSHLKGAEGISRSMIFWLVVSTPLKNISQNGNLPQIGMKKKKPPPSFKKPSGQRKTKGGEYPFAIWSAWSTFEKRASQIDKSENKCHHGVPPRCRLNSFRKIHPTPLDAEKSPPFFFNGKPSVLYLFKPTQIWKTW